MESPIVLTGATGFVGRYVLRDLLATGASVVALARRRGDLSGTERVHAALRWLGCDASLYRDQLIVCDADILPSATGLPAESREWLAQCHAVIHAAADIRFNADERGEPWRTNLDGTRFVLDQIGPRCHTWIQVSTAYTSPVENGVAMESLTAPRRYRNAYEASKHAADCLVADRAASRGIRWAVVRPGVVVGEHQTGATCSYEGFYGPMLLLATLVRRADRDADGSVRLPLRYDIPSSGIRNLVPVDWVSQAIIRIARHATAHGVFHLAPSIATPDSVIDEVMRELWNVTGTGFVPGLSADQFTTLEKMFYRSIHRVAPNWYDEPRCDTRRFNRTVPGLACPVIDHAALIRLLRFAQKHDWGKQPHDGSLVDESPPFDCRYYLEEYLPKWAPSSSLPRLEHVTADIGFSIRGPGGGEWVCRMIRGEVESVTKGQPSTRRVCFETDATTFREIVHGRLSTQQAFFKRRVEIGGAIEIGLKLAMMFQQFVGEFPFAAECREAEHV